ncbi:MAG: DUF1566 domain-containing protein [Arenicellales bacterium]
MRKINKSVLRLSGHLMSGVFFSMLVLVGNALAAGGASITPVLSIILFDDAVPAVDTDPLRKLSSNGTPLSPSSSSWACVRDNVTGLIWQNLHFNNLYSWNTLDSSTFTATSCGYTNWRMPTSLELLTIVKPSASNPAIDEGYFSYIFSYYYWSSDIDPNDPTKGLSVHFIDGLSTPLNRSTPGYARLVNDGN